MKLHHIGLVLITIGVLPIIVMYVVNHLTTMMAAFILCGIFCLGIAALGKFLG